MIKGTGWYADPGGEPAMRFWDGSEWTDELRPISAMDLPPLDFMDTADLGVADLGVGERGGCDPGGIEARVAEQEATESEQTRLVSIADLPPVVTTEEVAKPTSTAARIAPEPAARIAPEPAAPSAENQAETSRPLRPFVLLTALLLVTPATFLCILPVAWVVRRFAGLPGWTAFVAWALTGLILFAPRVREGLEMLAPSHSRPAHGLAPSHSRPAHGLAPSHSRPAHGLAPHEVHPEPTGQLALLTWWAGPVLLALSAIRVLSRVLDRVWSFTRHLASTGQGRRTSQSTMAIVMGLIRGTLFWLLWVTVGSLWLLVHGLRMGADGVRWFTATCGDRIRRSSL